MTIRLFTPDPPIANPDNYKNNQIRTTPFDGNLIFAKFLKRHVVIFNPLLTNKLFR